MSKKINILKEFLIEEYIDKRKSTAEIANLLGCSHTTISNYLKKYNIKTRPSTPRRVSIHKTIDGIEMKWCNTCRQWKPLDMFYKNENAWDGREHKCKNCISKRNKNQSKVSKKQHSETNKTWYKANIEHCRKTTKIWRKANPEKINAKSSKERAMRLNAMPKDADHEKLIFYRTVCDETNEILGWAYFNVDHIQPFAKGGQHHEDNLQILEAHLNFQKSAKWPLTSEEQIKYAGYKYENNLRN